MIERVIRTLEANACITLAVLRKYSISTSEVSGCSDFGMIAAWPVPMELRELIQYD